MGYTHYYRRPSTLDALRFSFFVDDVRAIVAALPEAAALSDVGITPDGVTFNGKPPADYGTFDLPRVRVDRPRPYRTEPDIGPTGEPLVFQCCKTQRRPYDLAVCAVLLRFARHFPGAVVTSDGSPEDRADALALVARTFPRDPSPVRVIDLRGCGSLLVPHDDPRPTFDAEWRNSWTTIAAMTPAEKAAHNVRVSELVALGVDYTDARIRAAREHKARQIPEAQQVHNRYHCLCGAAWELTSGSAHDDKCPECGLAISPDDAPGDDEGDGPGNVPTTPAPTAGPPAPAAPATPGTSAPAAPPARPVLPEGYNTSFHPDAPLRNGPFTDRLDPSDRVASDLLPARRLTLADFKRFIAKHRARLLVLHESDFSGHDDCVSTLRGDFAPARPDTKFNDDRYTLGIAGVYLVDGGGNRFRPWISADLVGIQMHNCCGSCVVAVRRSDLQASAPAPAPTGDTTTDPRRPSPGVAGDTIDAAPGVTLRANPQRGGIELHFDRKPAESVRSDLKSAGWRWSGASSCWYRSDTPDARAFALDVVASFRTSSGTPGTPPDALQATPARDPRERQILTPAGDDDATAVFTDRAAAEAAAAAAMPRRKHDRPFVQPSGYYSRRLGRDAWIVCANPNWCLLSDGTMHDVASGPIPAPARDPRERQIQRPDAPTGSRVGQLVAYYSDRANRFARDAADLERPSTQNHTPKRGRQWAVKRHDAANLRRAERAALALSAAWSAVMTSADPLAYERIPESLRAKLSAKHLCAYTRTRGVSNSYYHYADTHEPACTSAPAVALRALVDAFDVNARADDAKRKADAELREKIDALRGLTIDGFFPSPPAVVRRVVELADLRPGLSVLEPSAGLGDLAEAARAAGCSVRCVEQLLPAVQILRARGFDVTDADFLAIYPPTFAITTGTPAYDRVLMNPPFERNAAMRHVLHALKFLKPGGKLVAVLPASITDHEVDDALAYEPVDLFELSDPVAGAFDTPDAFRRTGVAVRFLTIDRADDATRAETPTRDESKPATPAPTVDTSDDVDALDDAPAAAPAAGPGAQPERHQSATTQHLTPAAPRQCDHCGRSLSADAVLRHEAHACTDGRTRCARCYVLHLEDVARAAQPPAPAAGPAARRPVDASFYTPVVAAAPATVADLPDDDDATPSTLSSLIATLRARHA
jgi:SAM-dependent methyltransferase